MEREREKGLKIERRKAHKIIARARHSLDMDRGRDMDKKWREKRSRERNRNMHDILSFFLFISLNFYNF